MSLWTECCCDHVSFLGHMDFLGNSHRLLLLLTRPCVGGEGTVRENVEIFSLDKRVEGETPDQDGAHGKREWKPGLERNQSRLPWPGQAGSRGARPVRSLTQGRVLRAE